MKTIFIPAGLMLAVVFLSGCGPTTVRTAPDEAAVELEAKRQMEFALREQLNKQERLQNVGWPVLEAGLPLCVDRKRWAIGAFYANQHDFPKELQETAVSMLGGGEDLQILTLVRDSPAAASGLQKGDVIISVNAKNVPAGKDASGKFSDLLKQELENGKAVDFVVRREGVQETASITPVEICDYPLALLNQNVVNAYADGNNIVVFSGLMDFARTDQELSLVLAHELSHNAMRHIDAKKVNFFIGFLFDILVIGVTGVDLGIRNATALAYSQEFEAEADYVALYIMARAGIPLENSADFWRRISTNDPEAITKYFLATHPSTPERFVAMEDTINEINLKITGNTELMPNINKNALQQREPVPRPEPQLMYAPR